MPLLPVLLISGVLVAFWVALVVFLVRNEGKRARGDHSQFARLCQALPGNSPDPNHHEVRRGERGFFLTYTPKSKHAPVSLSVSLPPPLAMPSLSAPAGAASPVLLRAEKRSDRFGKALGINRETQTGDAEFDHAVYVETDAPDRVVKALLGDPEVRRLVLEWHRAGWAEVRFFAGPGEWVRVQAPSPSEAMFEAATVEQVLGQLERIAPKLPTPDALPHHRKPSRGKWAIGLSVTLSFVGWVLPLASVNLWPTLENGPIVASALVGVALWLVLVPVSGLWLRGRSDSLRTLAFSLGWLCFGLPPLAVGVLTGANALLDSSPGHEHVVEVTDLWRTTGKNTSYNLRVRHWDRPGESLRMRVRHPLYQRFEKMPAPRRAAIVVRDGALGWPWRSGIRVADDDGS